MGILTEFAKEFAKGYVRERGVQGTMEDAVSLMQDVGNVGKNSSVATRRRMEVTSTMSMKTTRLKRITLMKRHGRNCVME